MVETFSKENREKALQLDWNTGYADPLNNFTGFATWFGFFKGKSLAFIVEDLIEEDFDPEDPTSVAAGIIELFHVKLETPGYESTFPRKATLHVKLIDHDVENHGKDIVLETTLTLKAKDNGNFYFANPKKAMQIFQKLDSEATKITEEPYVMEKGREIKIVKISGVNEDNIEAKNVPEIEGVVMTHKIFIGTFQVEAGWQWFGRPEGLFQARQSGFIQ